MSANKTNIIKRITNYFHESSRKTYDLAIELSGKPKALYVLFLIAFLESSFFPIPPDIFLIPMVIATPKKAFKIAFIATAASVLGGYLGYFIGFYLYDLVAQPVLEFYNHLEHFETFKEHYNKWGAWIVFGAGTTPFPYKVITVASGAVNMDMLIFGVASFLSRGLRFFAISILLWKFGAPVKKIIEKHFGLLATAFFILLVASFMLLKLL